MLLNESDLKKLIKDLIKEVRSEDDSFGDDLLDIPTHRRENNLFNSALAQSLREIRKLPGMHQVDENTYIYGDADLPERLSNEVIGIIIDTCIRLDPDNLSGMTRHDLESIFYNNEMPQDGGSHTIAEIVAMFIPAS